MKRIKKLSSLFLVFMLSFGIFMSVNVNATGAFTVKIQMTGMRGEDSNSTEVIAQGTVPYTSDMTAFDAIKAIAINPTDTDTTEVIDGVTYHNKGLLRWCESYYGDYISAIKVQGHSNNNKFFDDDGTASYDSISGNRGDYFKLSSLNATATALHYTGGLTTWSNSVHLDNYVSEKDYNKFSGWMLLIGGNTNNNGLGTTLVYNSEDPSANTVVLDFSMMMGLDLGQSSYMQDASSGEWVPVSAWN